MRTPFTGQPSEGGIFMKYSYEYKRQCVTLYRKGSWPLTPKGVHPKRFRNMIRQWVRTEEAQGPEALRHKAQNKVWTAAEKLALVAKISAGYSICSVACQAGINSGMLYTWVRKYKTLGYTGLIPKQKGRPAKYTAMKKRIALREQKQAVQLKAKKQHNIRSGMEFAGYTVPSVLSAIPSTTNEYNA